MYPPSDGPCGLDRHLNLSPARRPFYPRARSGNPGASVTHPLLRSAVLWV